MIYKLTEKINCMSDNNSSQVIVVDLDNTLINTDILYELIICSIKKSPLTSLSLLYTLLRKGKESFKEKISECVNLNVASLPYNNQLINLLREKKISGKKIVLCTAVDKRITNCVAEYLNLFDEIITINGSVKNIEFNKREVLEYKFEKKGFDYVGNPSDDLEVYKSAKCSILINSNFATLKKIAEVSTVTKVFVKQNSKFKDWSGVFRLHQWIKNLLLFVPLIAAHEFSNFKLVIALIIAFFSFSLCASAIYILNDLLDLESDRKHSQKIHRPFANGSVSIKKGLILIPLLMLASIVMSSFVDKEFVKLLIIYFLLSCAYSIKIKQLFFIDCLTLAILYMMRILAGAATTNIPLSFWLLSFSISIFLSLALVKRYSELKEKIKLKLKDNFCIPGRSYVISDAPILLIIGITSGYSSILMLFIYSQSTTAIMLYQKPEFIWSIALLIFFWINWIWIKAFRGEIHHDPVLFATKDKTSLMIVMLTIILFIFANFNLN